jgi:outer membrane scaffolding protein for murein synthesis (MipA/OmpV family)
VVSGVLLLGLLVPAQAGGLPDGYNDPSWTVGGIVAVKPKYEGSKSYEVVGAPFLYPSFGGLGNNLMIRGVDDIRYRVINANGFMAGPLAGYNFGRDEDDGRRLAGLGDLDGGVVLGAFIGYRFAPWLVLDVSYHRTLSGDIDGGQLRFGLETETPLSQRVTLLGRVGATYADDDYMASYFGVSAVQAGNSTFGLATYDAGAGIKDVHVELGARILMDDRWSLKLSGRYGRLVGDAADSPIIETEDQFSGSASVSYKIGTLR